MNTDQRDAASARLFPDGTTELRLRVLGDGVPAFAGCVSTQSSQTIETRYALRIANP